MFKKIILSAVAIATLSASAFANDGIQISKETLMNNSSKMDYMYMANLKQCHKTTDAFKSLFKNYPDQFTDTKTAINFALSILLNPTITAGYDNTSLTIIKAENISYYYFDSLEGCNETMNRFNK